MLCTTYNRVMALDLFNVLYLYIPIHVLVCYMVPYLINNFGPFGGAY